MKKLLSLLLTTTLTGVGCIQIQTRAGAGDGGVFKSVDFGESWTQKVFIRQEKNRLFSIADVNVVNMVIDPQNTQTIYLGSRENGMFLTSDGGERWQPLLTDKGTIRAIAVDPRNKEVVYSAVKEKIVKSTDGGKTWKLIYSEPRLQPITEIQVDSFDTKKVYAGVTTGEVIKSQDSGESWTLVGNFESPIQKIIINPKDTRVIFAATSSNGILKSENGGLAWNNLKAGYQKFDGALSFQDLSLNPSQPSFLLYASDYGLLKSDDSGINWQEIKLLTPPKSVTILSVALNPKNPSQIIYGTTQNLFKTKDGGQTWVSKPLPTSRAPNRLMVDPGNPQIIYLGALRIKK